MIDAFTIERMSLAERLHPIELLWRSLSRDPESVASPAWHGEVIAERLAEIEKGNAEFITVEELKPRLTKPRE